LLERSPRDEVGVAAPVALPAWRPMLVFLGVGVTMAGLIWLAVIALSPGGFSAVDLVLVVLFALTLPWYVIGVWNATIGLLIMRFARDPVAAVMPVAGRVRGDEPITASTAVLLCIRNEPPERVVRIMQIDPRLGIVQSLVIGMPSASAFARIFQFGMRLSMRSYTIGSAWWQGDCGPYWGHNAIVRIAPLVAHCQLPVLAEGALVKGHVLSHDQIEAVPMRRAGYGVRVLAGEGSSFEQNPPTLVEFIRRDLRWCQGNMQYWHFLRMPGLPFLSRYQLAFAILMFLGSPAWMGLLLIGSAAVALAPTPADFMRWDAGIAILVLVLAMWFAPNIATLIDVLTRAKLRQLFGGGARFSASFMITIVFAVLVAPIMWASHTLFLAHLACGRTIDWSAQARHDHEVPWSLACRQFWPQTLIGLAPVLLLAVAAPSAIPYALLIAAGPLLSIPLAVVTAAAALRHAQ